MEQAAAVVMHTTSVAAQECIDAGIIAMNAEIDGIAGQMLRALGAAN